MANHYEIKTSRHGNDGKVYWTRIGTMWPGKNNSYRITFDALPIPTLYEGKIRVEAMAFEPLEKTDAPRAKIAHATDDEIPF